MASCAILAESMAAEDPDLPRFLLEREWAWEQAWRDFLVARARERVERLAADLRATRGDA